MSVCLGTLSGCVVVGMAATPGLAAPEAIPDVAETVSSDPLAATDPAASDPRDRVVLVRASRCCRGRANPQLERSIAAELRATGIEVLWADGIVAAARERRIELGVLAEDRSAAAALRVLRGKGADTLQVEVWLTGGPSGRPVFRDLNVAISGDGALSSAVTLRVVEMLRARIHGERVGDWDPGTETSMHEGATSIPTSWEDASGVERAPEYFFVFARALLYWAAGGSRARYSADLGVSWSLSPHWILGCDVTVPITSDRVSRPPEAASWFSASGNLWLHRAWHWAPRSRLSIGPSAGVLATFARGKDAEGFSTRNVRTFGGHVGVSAEGSLRIYGPLWAQIGSRVGWARPEPALRLGGEVQARLRPPLVEAFLGVAGGF